MENENSSEIRPRVNETAVNRTTLLCGITGLLLLSLGGLPLLDRVWAHLGSAYWAFPAARDVLSVVVGVVLVTVAVAAHRRTWQAAQTADVR